MTEVIKEQELKVAGRLLKTEIIPIDNDGGCTGTVFCRFYLLQYGYQSPFLLLVMCF